MAKKVVTTLLALMAGNALYELLKGESPVVPIGKLLRDNGLILSFVDVPVALKNVDVVKSTVMVQDEDNNTVTAGGFSDDGITLQQMTKEARKAALEALFTQVCASAPAEQPAPEKAVAVEEPAETKVEEPASAPSSPAAEPQAPVSKLPALTKSNPNWKAIVAQAKKIGNAKEVYEQLAKVFTVKEDVLAALLSEAGLS